MTLLYLILKIYSKRFFLNVKELPDSKVVSLTKKNMALQYIFDNF